MRRNTFSIIAAVTLLFAGFLLGYFTGRNVSGPQILVAPGVSDGPAVVTAPPLEEAETIDAVTFPININTASAEMLAQLPGIGEVLAGRIIEYRQAFGAFETPEELMEVEGISENRFHSLADLISVHEGSPIP